MSQKSVICIANCRNLAELIVDQLKFYGISPQDISLLYPDVEKNGRKTHHFEAAPGLTEAKGVPAGEGSGGAVGGVLGWIKGIGALTVPGAGAFIAAGPIIGFLSGSTTGGIALGLRAMGLRESQARHYEDRIRLGNLLISVHTQSPAEAMQAKFIFTRGRGQDICLTDEAFLPQAHPMSPRDRIGLPRHSTHFWPDLSPLTGGSSSHVSLATSNPMERAGHPGLPG